MQMKLDLDVALLDQVVSLGRFSARSAAINAALTEYLRLLKRRELLALQGQVPWVGDLDGLRARG